jgi:hypothetical protein
VAGLEYPRKYGFNIASRRHIFLAIADRAFPSKKTGPVVFLVPREDE